MRLGGRRALKKDGIGKGCTEGLGQSDCIHSCEDFLEANISAITREIAVVRKTVDEWAWTS